MLQQDVTENSAIPPYILNADHPAETSKWSV
jgi:hypothetical protein